MPRAKRKSNVGAAVTRLIALKHGITAGSPVLPGVESAEDWEAFRQGLIDDRQPQGAFEELLVERIANAAWHLKRIVRYQVESTLAFRDRAAFDYQRMHMWTAHPGSVADAEEARVAAERRLDIILEVTKMPAASPLPEDDVANILADLAEAADQDEDEFLDGISRANRDGPWTAGRLVGVLKALARRDAIGFTESMSSVAARMRATATGAEVAIAATRDEVERLRRQRLLPDAPTLDRILKYEATYNRMLYQASNQLEAAQSRRAGAPTPLLRTRIYGLSGQ